MPDLCGNCAMNVPRMGICGRKPILVFSPPSPPSCSSLWFFPALRVQKEAGRGSWVSGWWAAFVAAPSSCLAFVPCFVQIEKCYVFSNHFSLPGEWSFWLSLITDISPRFPANRFYHWWLMNRLQLPSWRFSSQLASAHTRGRRPARPKSTGNGWLFRFDLIFPITWWCYLIVGGGGGQGEEEHSGHLRGRENPNKAQVGCASAFDACLWWWAIGGTNDELSNLITWALVDWEL